MSTAVLPRFSEFFRGLHGHVDHDSLILPPLRTFPESFSRDSPLLERQGMARRDTSRYRTGCSFPFHDFSNNVVSEVHSSSSDASFRDRNSCSGDSSSDEGMDHENDLELSRGQHLPQIVSLKSPIQNGKLPVSGQLKPKKVKYHFCEICQKPFPRPSGLRAHMNMHTKEKPFGCGFPGCPKRFSVSSNAKRHLRTHGVGLSPSDEPAPLPYVVDFEEPVVVTSDGDDSPSSSTEPLSLRWMPLGVGSRRSHRVQRHSEVP